MDPQPARQARPDQPIARLSLEQLQPGDVDDIYAIARQSFSNVWAKDDFAHFLSHASGFCYGMVTTEGTRHVHAYFLALLAHGDIDVISIATDPTMRMQGLAEQLLRYVCASPSVARVFLEVDVNNVAAIGLYRKLNFQTLGIRKKYYAHKTDALVMRWSK